MADPLSIASSITGLISLAKALLPLLVNVVGDVVHAQQEHSMEHNAIILEIRGLCEVLHALQPVVQRLEVAKTGSSSIVSTREGSSQCRKYFANQAVRGRYCFHGSAAGL